MQKNIWQNKEFSTKRMVFMALMIALSVVLSLTTSIQITSGLRISIFSFIPITLPAMFLGPVWGAVTGLVCDVINFLVENSKYGPYHIGYTLVASLSGMWYGLVLHQKKINWLRALMCITPVILVGEMFLNSIWVVQQYGWGYVPMRLLANLIECPLKISVLMLVIKPLERIPKSYLKL